MVPRNFLSAADQHVSALSSPFVSHADPEGWLAARYPVVLVAVLSAVAAYFWLLSFGSAPAALLGAIFYVAAPYHLAMDVFVAGRPREVWVFVWFPLVLIGAEKLIRRSRWAIAVTAISFALAVLSHPTTSLCFVPIPISYVFFFSKGKDRARNASLMLASLLLGVGLSAVYILPAMLDQGKAQTQLYRIGMLDYHNEWLIQDTAQLGYFLRGSSGAAISKSSDVGFLPFKSRIFQVTALTLLMAVLLFMVSRRFEGAPRPRRLALFWITVALITLFLMNRPSAFVWNLARFLQFLQFPFRFNIMLVICVAALVPLAYPYLKTAKVFTVVLCALLGVWLVVDVHYSRTNFFATGVANRNLRLDYEPLILRQMDAPEMLPIPGNPSAMSSISGFDWFIATHPPRAVSLEAIGRQSSGTVVVQSWQPRHIVLKIDALRSTVLKVNHFYYSGCSSLGAREITPSTSLVAV